MDLELVERFICYGTWFDDYAMFLSFDAVVEFVFGNLSVVCVFSDEVGFVDLVDVVVIGGGFIDDVFWFGWLC